MFEQVFDNLKKATESSIQMQQEMFQKWVGMFPAAPGAAAAAAAGGAAGAATGNPAAGLNAAAAFDAMTRWQKKFEETMTESLKRQRDLVDSHYTAGLRTLEEMFRVGQSKSPQEYQDKVMQLYRQCFDSLRQLSESQMKEFKAAAERWTELMTKAA